MASKYNIIKRKKEEIGMDSNNYSELYGILIMLGKSYISKLPHDFMELVVKNKNSNYNPVYTIEDINNQNISESVYETLSQLYDYWF